MVLPAHPVTWAALVTVLLPAMTLSAAPSSIIHTRSTPSALAQAAGALPALASLAPLAPCNTPLVLASVCTADPMPSPVFRAPNTERRAPSAVRRSDIIMSAAGLNDILKRMTRLTQQVQSAEKPGRVEALFALGVEADGLANLMNREVEAHGMQERELLDLALSRTKELGVMIQYNKQKKSFFYDGSAFTQYLAEAPRGQHAAAAEFQLLSYQFYQSTSTDAATLETAAAAKQRFVEKHPTFKGNAEMRLYLAIDYRDLYHLYKDAHDAARMERFYQRTRSEFQRVVKLYPGTEQADAARQQLQKLEEERRYLE